MRVASRRRRRARATARPHRRGAQRALEQRRCARHHRERRRHGSDVDRHARQAVRVSDEAGKPVVAAELSPVDNIVVLTASQDHTATVWSLGDPDDERGLRSPRALVQLVGHSDEIVGGDVRCRRRAGRDRRARWRREGVGCRDRRSPRLVRARRLVIPRIAFAGDRLVTGDRHGTVHTSGCGRRSAGKRRDARSPVPAVAAAGSVVAAAADSRVMLWRGSNKVVLREHVEQRPRGRALERWHGPGHGGRSARRSCGTWRPRRRAAELGPARRCRSRALAIAGRQGGARVTHRDRGVVARRMRAHRGARRRSCCRGDRRRWRADRGRGRRLASSCGRPSRTILASAGAARAVAFSPDGATLLVGGNGFAKLVDVATGRERSTLDGPFGDVTALAWLDGARVVTANSDGSREIWDAGKGKLLGVRGVRGAAVRSLAVTGDTLWLGGDDARRARGTCASSRPDDSTATSSCATHSHWQLDADDVVRRRGGD